MGASYHIVWLVVSLEIEGHTIRNQNIIQFELNTKQDTIINPCKELSLSVSGSRVCMSAQEAPPGLLMFQSVEHLLFGKSHETALEEVLQYFEGLHAGTHNLAPVVEAWRVGVGGSNGIHERACPVSCH